MTRGQTPHLKKAFLEAFRKNGNVSESASSIGIDRKLHYRWLDKDQKYFKAFTDAEAEAVDVLEKEARRRGQEGVEEPVFYLGKEVGKVRKYSDTLLIFLLKGARPEKYRERYEVAGPGGGPVRILVTYEDSPKPAEPKKS